MKCIKVCDSVSTLISATDILKGSCWTSIRNCYISLTDPGWIISMHCMTWIEEDACLQNISASSINAWWHQAVHLEVDYVLLMIQIKQNPKGFYKDFAINMQFTSNK